MIRKGSGEKALYPERHSRNLFQPGLNLDAAASPAVCDLEVFQKRVQLSSKPEIMLLINCIFSA